MNIRVRSLSAIKFIWQFFIVYSEITFVKTRYRIGTSQLMCKTNQLTSFYMVFIWYLYGSFYWNVYPNRPYLFESFLECYQLTFSTSFAVWCLLCPVQHITGKQLGGVWLRVMTNLKRGKIKLLIPKFWYTWEILR